MYIFHHNLKRHNILLNIVEKKAHKKVLELKSFWLNEVCKYLWKFECIQDFFLCIIIMMKVPYFRALKEKSHKNMKLQQTCKRFLFPQIFLMNEVKMCWSDLIDLILYFYTKLYAMVMVIWHNRSSIWNRAGSDILTSYEVKSLNTQPLYKWVIKAAGLQANKNSAMGFMLVSNSVMLVTIFGVVHWWMP